MIVIDSSAVVAILFGEPEAAALNAVALRNRAVMSALNVFETETVVRSRLGQGDVHRVRAWLRHQSCEIFAFSDTQAQMASAAYAKFGRGQHRARLNLSDCAAYALAKSLDAPLLYKGDDFARTDIAPAVTPD